MNTGKKIGFAVSLLTLAVGAAMAAGPQADVTSDSQAMTRTVGVGQNGIDAQALARAQTKLSLAVQLTHRFDASAAQEGRSNDLWRSSLIASLMQMNESDFAAVESSPTLSDAINSAARAAGNVTAPGGTAASIGTTNQDLTYVPINPCRILDTRVGSGNGFSAGQTRNYSFNSSNVGNGGCTPSVYGSYSGLQYPAAVAANVTVDETGLTGFAAGSYLAIYPQGGSAGTSFINFGPNQILANAGVFSVNVSNGQFTVLASAPAQVIIDVYGVFLPPLPTALECTNATSTSSFLGIVVATCPSGYGLSGGGCTSNSIYDHAYANYPSSATNWTCGFFPEGSNTIGSTLTAYARCCRVPGRG